MTQARIKNTVRNTFFGAVTYISKMLLNFVVRAVFIRYLTVEYLGLNGLYSNILNVLSLAELGVGNAIVYSMYKPIAENDIDKIKALTNLYKKLYWIIGAAVTVIGLSLIPALPYLIKDAPNVDVNLTIIYVMYLAQTVIGYFFAYRRSLIFAYQRNDIESKTNLVAVLLLSVAQILIMAIWKNYYAYVFAMIVFNALDAAVVFFLSYRLFPHIRGKAPKLDKASVRSIAKNTGAMVCHKLGGTIVFSSDSIIISAFLGVGVLGLYSNYTLVIAAITSIFNLFITAIKSSVGNLIATADKETAYERFLSLNLINMWLTGFGLIGLFTCFQSFIVILAGDSQFQLPFLSVALLCISFYLTQSRRMTDNFKECAGLFWNDRYKPLFEAGINLALNLLLVRFWGINGVIIATIISTIAAPLWVEPYVLYKHYFKKSLWRYFARYAIYTIITCAAGAATFGICWFIPADGIGWFILKFSVCLLVPNLIFWAAYCKTPEFKYLVSVAKGILRKRRLMPDPVGELPDGEIDSSVPSETNAGDAGEEGDRNKPES